VIVLVPVQVPVPVVVLSFGGSLHATSFIYVSVCYFLNNSKAKKINYFLESSFGIKTILVSCFSVLLNSILYNIMHFEETMIILIL